MPDDETVSRALLQSVTEGSYPESEDTITATLAPSALPTALKYLSDAREEVKKEISALSATAAPDIDGWITQARQLHADIQSSIQAAREIRTSHSESQRLRSIAQDHAAKTALLKQEVAFNQELVSTLEKIQTLSKKLDDARISLGNGDIIEAIDGVEELERELHEESALGSTRVATILADRASSFRESIGDEVRLRWRDLVRIDRAAGKLEVVDQDSDRGSEYIVILNALNRLGIFENAVELLYKEIYSSLLYPIVSNSPAGTANSVDLGADTVQLDPTRRPSNVSGVLDSITAIVKYLDDRLPKEVSEALSAKLMTPLIAKLTANWLSHSLPVDVESMASYQSTLDRIENFSVMLDKIQWTGAAELKSWVGSGPRLWLTKRRIGALDRVRGVLSQSKLSTKQVERVEKQTVTQDDEVFATTGGDDDWNAGWDDDADEKGDDAGQRATEASEEKDEDAGDDWGWGDDGDGNDDDWGDDDKGPGAKNVASSPSKLSKTTSASTKKNHMPDAPVKEKEIILKETYTITDVPDAVLDIIVSQIRDAETLADPEFPKSTIGTASTGLLNLPTQVLAMFRAIAPSFYNSKLSTGNMNLYNDTLYLGNRLHELVSTSTTNLSRLDPDIAALEKFGKASYAREMESQRQILGDLLDGAQGFSGCTDYPLSAECDVAVSSTVDRIKQVNAEWASILSHSALLQSTGSLLSTVINKMIVDVEDMSDISEPESQRLCTYFAQVSKLEDLFTPETAGTQTEAVPMTAVYVPNWLKFQYLSQILESSLVDIKYLWTEGELSLEFSAEELIDLIEALFADSDHRRKAIGQIRRVSRQ